MIESIPHPTNFCGGNFQDWLEVNLTNACNAKCVWCVEKPGWHPKEHADWEVIADAAIATGKTNIILLGGEPALYKDLSKVIRKLRQQGLRAWVTTNGTTLSREWVQKNLQGVHGVNISVHHYDMTRNADITKVLIDEQDLREGVEAIHDMGAQVRFNCNCIKGQIDSVEEIRAYIAWVRSVDGDKIRFAELKLDDEGFVDLAAVLEHKYGLNDNPFAEGCNSDAVIDGMSVNFRQMCGLQTRMRPMPVNPKQYEKQVLYYDGKIYNGWQQAEDHKDDEMKAANFKILIAILDDVESGTITAAQAAVKIDTLNARELIDADNASRLKRAGGGFSGGVGGGCQY